MKKALIVGLVLVLVLAMGLVACGEDEETTTTAAAGETSTTAGAETTTTAAAETTTSAASETTTTSGYAEGTWKFTFNNFMPPTNNIGVVSEMLCAEIDKRTNGAVKFEYLPGGSLTKADKVFDSVVTGIADLGYSCFTYTPGVFPVMELLDYPLGYPHGYVDTMVVNDFYNEFKPAELDDVHVLVVGKRRAFPRRSRGHKARYAVLNLEVHQTAQCLLVYVPLVGEGSDNGRVYSSKHVVHPPMMLSIRSSIS